MSKLTRRQMLVTMGGLGAGICLTGRATAQPRPLDIMALAARLRLTPRGEVFQLSAGALKQGAPLSTLLGAAFLAGAQELRPGPMGGKLHAILMIESTFQLIEESDRRQQLLATLWAMDDFKRWQARDIRQGDWQLSPANPMTFSSSQQGKAALRDALDNWDADRADRAVSGLASMISLEEMFDLLRPYGLRCYKDLGHKVIYCAHAERTLKRIGWQFAPDLLRNMVRGFAYTEDDPSGDDQEFKNAGQLAPQIKANWLAGKEDPSQSKQLLKLFRGTNPAQAQKLVVDAFNDGLGPNTVWDGIRLLASELFHQRPSNATRRHGPVHPVTETNALGYLFRVAKKDEVKKLAVLQAAGWMPRLRDDLARFFGENRSDLLWELSQQQEQLPLDQVYAQPSPDTAAAYLQSQPAAATQYLARMRKELFQKGYQNHQYKLCAALSEETRLAHKAFAPVLLAPSITYMLNGKDTSTEAYQGSLAALKAENLL